ncbi:MAG: hypothetical protein EBU97_05480, partial [Rhodobacteraceae bacterium]|nr:hypothetical protein [Paracoccaceae bacterium]
ASHNTLSAQIGHGTTVMLNQYPYAPNLQGPSMQDYGIVLGRIGKYTDVAGHQLTSDIIVDLNEPVYGGLDVGSDITDQNGENGDVAVSRLGHGSVIVAKASGSLSVTDGVIMGNVSVAQHNTGSIAVHSAVTAATAAAEGGTYLASIGHGSYFDLTSGNDFENASDGGSIEVTEANILGAAIQVQQLNTMASGVNGEDSISVSTAATAGLVAASHNTLSAQIGHGGYVLAQASEGEQATNPNNPFGPKIGSAGGSVTVNKGTVSGGYLDDTTACR